MPERASFSAASTSFFQSMVMDPSGAVNLSTTRPRSAGLEDVPREAREGLRIVLVDSAEELLPLALGEGPPAVEGTRTAPA